MFCYIRVFESNVILNRFKTLPLVKQDIKKFESNVILNRFKTLKKVNF